MPTQIERAIVHELPKGTYSSKDPSKAVACSSVLSQLDVDTTRFLEEDVIDHALRAPRAIVDDPEADANISEHVATMLGDDHASFVRSSKALARSLFNAQSATSPAGIFIAATVHREGKRWVLLLKAEHQEGVRVSRAADGVDELGLELLKDLIVGENSRVYKVALLTLDDQLLHGRMVDRQNGRGFAGFFLSQYLGCKLVDDAEVETKIFADSAMRWITDHLPEEERAVATMGLFSYLRSPEETFQPSEFADRHLDISYHDNFLESLPERLGDREIQKNMDLVNGNGTGLRFVGDGFTVTADESAVSNHLIEVDGPDDDGITRIAIRGTLRKYEFASAPKSRPVQ